MPEAVIVSTARSPIGRAMKGSLVECRPDDLAAGIVTAALEKVPQLDPGSVDDLMMGCGQPAASRASTWLGWRASSPGCRTCRV
jgi:acetyl-CoA C-acetyltransferase